MAWPGEQTRNIRRSLAAEVRRRAIDAVVAGGEGISGLLQARQHRGAVAPKSFCVANMSTSEEISL